MTAFTEISVLVDGEAAEAVAEMLRPFAYQESVVLEQKGDAANQDPLALEKEVTVKIYVPQAEDTPALRRRIGEILYHLNRLYPVPEPQFRLLEEKDWAHAWKENYHPFRVGGRIWIKPSWIDEARDPSGEAASDGDIVLVMDPGMAFGTGLHPTTQACLHALEKSVQQDDRLLDVGTGTGILAIAAARLGATEIAAVDNDELAVKATRENARLNGVEGLVKAWQGELGSVTEREWDDVVVNILAPVVIDLLNNAGLLAYVAPQGRLILSGIIDAQADDVRHALAAAGGSVVETLPIGDWVTFIAAHDR
jgi:ribosomal protein L11 methyltransferase